MDLRDLNHQLHLQPAPALLADATGAEIFWLRTQLERWLDLCDRELHQRYPVLAQADAARALRQRARA